MHIGLIGGIGPAATDFYYRRLISTFASKKAALELTIVHADTPTLLGNLANNDAATQVAILPASMRTQSRIWPPPEIVATSAPRRGGGRSPSRFQGERIRLWFSL